MTDPTGLTFGRVGLLGPALSSHCCGWNDLVEPYIVARWTCVLVTGDLAGRGDEVTTPAWGGVSRSVVVRAPWPARGPMVP